MATFVLSANGVDDAGSWTNPTNVFTANGSLATSNTEFDELKVDLEAPDSPPFIDDDEVVSISVLCKTDGPGVQMIAHIHQGVGPSLGSWSASKTVNNGTLTTLTGSFNVSNITNPNTLKVRIVIFDLAGATVSVDRIYATFTQLEIPAEPTNVQATNGTFDDRIRVSWDNKPKTDNYNIYRNTVNNFNTATLIGTTTGTPYADDYIPPDPFPPSPGITYYYWVTGENDAGETDPGGPNTGWLLLSSVTITPAPIEVALETLIGNVDTGPLVITPRPITVRLSTKAPFQLAETDIDGFFQSLAQAHAYTNYGYRQRDTFFAIDQANNTVVWVYPTTSSDSFVKQLPRVMLAINAKTKGIGLGYPLPIEQVGSHTPLKTKNIFGVLTGGPYPWRRKQTSIFAFGATEGTPDDTTSDTEILGKDLYTMNMQIFYGINSNYGDASIYTKFFRPPTKEPNIMTKIHTVKPVFSHGNAGNLTMRGNLWTVSSYLHDDNALARSPDHSSDFIIDGSVIVFSDSTYGLEHCVSLSFDTNAGSAAWAPEEGYTGGGFIGIEIGYSEQQIGFK